MIASQILAQVQEVLTDQPAPLRVVHQRIDCWAKDYIAIVLRELVKQKRAVAVGDLQQRTYRAA